MRERERSSLVRRLLPLPDFIRARGFAALRLLANARLSVLLAARLCIGLAVAGMSCTFTPGGGGGGGGSGEAVALLVRIFGGAGMNGFGSIG